MPATAFTTALNDLALTLSAGYVPGSGILHLTDLSALPGGFPSATNKLRLSVDRTRDGAKTILIANGKAGNNLTGCVVAEGKVDIPLDAGDVAKCRISAGYINDLNAAVNALEVGGGGGSGTVTSVALTMPSQFTSPVSGSPVTTTGTLAVAWAAQNANKVLAGPATGADAVPTFRTIAAADLPDFTNTTKGAVPVPSPAGGTAKYLREDATWNVPPGSGGMSIGDSIASGTAGRVLYESTGPVLADSASLTYDGTKLDVASASTRVVPIMTSNTTPSPYVASASTEYSASFLAFRAFDRSSLDPWVSTANTGYLQIQLASAVTVTSYSLEGPQSVVGRAAKTWVVQGSNNGSSWTTIDSRSLSRAWIATEVRWFVIQSPGSYSYYKLVITGNFGDALCEIGEFDLRSGSVSILTDGALQAGILVSTDSIETVQLYSNFVTANTFEVAGASGKITTSSTELVLEETGDTFGTIQFKLQNHIGSNGAVVDNTTLGLVDIGLVGLGTQNNLRMEARSAYLANSTLNPTGEIQFIFDPLGTPVFGFYTGKELTAAPGVFAVGGTTVVASSRITARTLNATYSGLSVVGYTSQSAPLIKLYGTSSTSSDEVTGIIDSGFVVSTELSYTGWVELNTTDFNGVVRKGVRVESDGTKPLIGFLGKTAAGQQTGGSQTASGTWTATEQDMLQKAYDALRTFGLLS